MDARRARPGNRRSLTSRIVGPARRFRELQASSGIVLLAAAAAAMVWANSFGTSYRDFWSSTIEIGAGSAWAYRAPVTEFVNDALMALFFFVVGLEIKREFRLGALQDGKAAAMPAIAALGGMVFPALIYFAFNTGGEAAKGWGIPVATDITFVLGVVALVGRRLPSGARLFLLALALADDIGAILVIAVFYTSNLSLGWLVAALAGYGAVYTAKRSGIRIVTFYWVLGIAVWYCTFRSGIHPTLAAVALGFLAPTHALYPAEEFRERSRMLTVRHEDHDGPDDQELRDEAALRMSNLAREAVSPLHRLSRALQPWTAFFVAPVFALANAGISLSALEPGDVMTSSVSLGVALGLIVGKTIGILVAGYLAVRLGLGRLPAGVDWGHFFGLAVLGGTGFTVSLFITDLAFTDPILTDFSKIGILIGSTTAAIIGFLLLRWMTRPSRDVPVEPAGRR